MDLIKAILDYQDNKIKDAIRLIIMRFFVSVFIYFIPTIFIAFLGILDNIYDKNTLADCIENATLEKINYYDKKRGIDLLIVHMI